MTDSVNRRTTRGSLLGSDSDREYPGANSHITPEPQGRHREPIKTCSASFALHVSVSFDYGLPTGGPTGSGFGGTLTRAGTTNDTWSTPKLTSPHCLYHCE